MVTAVLFSGIVQGLLLVLLLFQKNVNRTSARILATLVFLIAAHLSLIAVDMNDLFVQLPHLSKLSWLLPLCYGPLILLLTQSLVQKTFTFRRSYTLYFLPFLIYLAILAPYYFQVASQKIAYLSNQEKVLKADFGWMNHLTNYFHIVYLLIALQLYNRQVKQQSTSIILQSNRKWLPHFLYFVLAILVFSLFVFYAKKFDIKGLSGIYPNHFLLVVILVYWIAYKMLQEKLDFETNDPQENEDNVEKPHKYSKTGLDAEASKLLARRLELHMETEKPYLDCTLTLTDLGSRLRITKHQISQVINSEFEVNFYEFVNNYRIEEFKKQSLHPSNEHLSIVGIAFEAGFNSKATFNQVFKKKEGMTPSEFVKQQKDKRVLNQHL